MYLPERPQIDRVVCPVCKGTGKVQVKTNGQTKEEECPRCEGRGFISCL